MRYQLKNRYKNAIITLREDNRLISINTRRYITQREFAQLYEKYGNKYVEIIDEKEVTPRDMTLGELRKLYPRISARSKNDFLTKMKKNGLEI